LDLGKKSIITTRVGSYQGSFPAVSARLILAGADGYSWDGVKEYNLPMIICKVNGVKHITGKG
jgi:hypothetical protein